MFDLNHEMTFDSICVHDILRTRRILLGVLFGVARTIASSGPAAFVPRARDRSAKGLRPPCAVMARPNPVAGGLSIGS